MTDLLRNAAIVEIDRLADSILDKIGQMRGRCEAAVEVVELPPKDCPCSHHDGPHWLHMDGLWRERNQALMADAVRLAEADPLTAATAFRGYLTEEVDRLTAKAAELGRLPRRVAHEPEPAHVSL